MGTWKGKVWVQIPGLSITAKTSAITVTEIGKHLPSARCGRCPSRPFTRVHCSNPSRHPWRRMGNLGTGPRSRGHCSSFAGEETEGQGTNQQRRGDSELVVRPSPASPVLRRSWPGAPGPEGCLEMWQRGPRAGPAGSPTSSSRFASQEADSLVTEFWVSTAGDTSHILQTIARFFRKHFISKWEAIYLLREKELQFSLMTVVLFFLSASLLGR